MMLPFICRRADGDGVHGGLGRLDGGTVEKGKGKGKERKREREKERERERGGGEREGEREKGKGKGKGTEKEKEKAIKEKEKGKDKEKEKERAVQLTPCVPCSCLDSVWFTTRVMQPMDGGVGCTWGCTVRVASQPKWT